MIRTTCQRCGCWSHTSDPEGAFDIAPLTCPDCGGLLEVAIIPEQSSLWFTLVKWLTIAALGWCVYWLATH